MFSRVDTSFLRGGAVSCRMGIMVLEPFRETAVQVGVSFCWVTRFWGGVSVHGIVFLLKVWVIW